MLKMLGQISQSNEILNFKSSAKNKRHQMTQVPNYSYDDIQADMFIEQQQAIKKAQKKEKSKENWNKAGVVAQMGIAVAFLSTVALTIFGIKKMGGKGDSASKSIKLAWEDIASKKNFPNLEDECVNEKVRDFIKTMKNRTDIPKEIIEHTGAEAPEQCILMWGPSGTGKTFSGQLFAKEMGAEYTKIQFADVSSPYIGQTSVEIQDVFNKLKKTASANPDKKYVVSFDEIDALLVPREKCGSNNLHLAENRTAFLNGLDEIKQFNNLKIIGTTNVDPASGNLDLASLSRFGNMIKIDLPSEKELKSALKFRLSKNKCVTDNKFFEKNKSAIDKFVKKLHDKKYSQRDVEDIVNKANSKFAIDKKSTTDIKADNFEMKYLEDAVKLKGNTTGSINSTGKDKQVAELNPSNFNFLQRLMYLIFGGGKA